MNGKFKPCSAMDSHAMASSKLSRFSRPSLLGSSDTECRRDRACRLLNLAALEMFGEEMSFIVPEPGGPHELEGR